MQLIATDLDGTFLADFDTISQQNLAAADRAHSAGIEFVIATGRPTRWVEFLVPILKHDDPLAVISNGAAIIKLATGEMVHCFPITKDQLRAATSALRRLIPGIYFGLECGTTFLVEKDFPLWSADQDAVCTGQLNDLIEQDIPVLKLVAKHHNLATEELYHAVSNCNDIDLELTYSFLGTPGIIEISAPGVSKAHALQVICADRGIPAAEVVAFGDMPNDLEMLAWAGQGFAMPAAHRVLRDAGIPLLSGDAETSVGRKLDELLDKICIQ